MKNKKRYPKLRFPGFTDPWEQRKLEKVVNVKSGRDYKHLKNGNIPVYGTGGYMLSVNTALSENNDAIGIGRKGTIDNPYILKAPFWTVDTLFYAIPNKENEINFVYGLFQKINWKRKDESTGVPSLSKSTINSVNVYTPSYSEQKLIGTVFQKIDLNIASNQREGIKLKNLKKAYMDKLFPKNGSKYPELRFPGFTDPWEQRQLGKTKTFFTDGNYGEAYPSEQDMSDKKNGVPFLRGSNLKNGKIDITSVNYITPEKHKKLTTGHLKLDDVILAVRGSLGSLGYVQRNNVGWNVNSQLAIIRTEKKELFGNFILQYLLTNNGQKELISRNTGTALKQLPIKQLKSVPIPFIDIKEQQKVAGTLSKVDQLIASNQREGEKLKALKQAYLNELFV